MPKKPHASQDLKPNAHLCPHSNSINCKNKDTISMNPITINRISRIDKLQTIETQFVVKDDNRQIWKPP